MRYTLAYTFTGAVSAFVLYVGEFEISLKVKIKNRHVIRLVSSDKFKFCFFQPYIMYSWEKESKSASHGM